MHLGATDGPVVPENPSVSYVAILVLTEPGVFGVH
jgi:hypothetical protein